MNLKLKTDYCIRVLIYLQTHEGQSNIQEIADAFQISKNHLRVVVNTLSELDYIISSQGPKGGIRINPEALEKSLADLVTKVEDFKIVECFDIANNTCSLAGQCMPQIIFSNASKAFIDELKRYKIKDLV